MFPTVFRSTQVQTKRLHCALTYHDCQHSSRWLGILHNVGGAEKYVYKCFTTLPVKPLRRKVLPLGQVSVVGLFTRNLIAPSLYTLSSRLLVGGINAKSNFVLRFLLPAIFVAGAAYCDTDNNPTSAITSPI